MAEAFIQISTDIQRPRSLAVAPSGDVYVVSGLYGMYKRAGGQGSFASVWDQWDPENEVDWSYGVCVLPNGNVVVGISGGRIAVQTAGVGPFVFQPGTTQAWRQIWCNSAGVLWGAVYGGGYIMKSTDGGATWTQASTIAGDWFAGCCQGSDVYAALFGGGLYKQTGGTGNFVEIDSSSHWFTELSLASDGHMLGADLFGDALEKLTKDGPWTTIPDAIRNGYIGICGDALGGIYACSGNEIYYKSPTGGGQTYAVDVNEALTETGTVGAVDKANQSVNETVTEAGAAAATERAAQGVSESVTETGTIGASKATSQAVSETVTETGTVAGSEKATQGLSETHTITDQLVATAKGIVTAAEALAMVEATAATGNSIVAAAETVGLAESATAGLVFAQMLTDALAAGESLTALAKAFQGVSESDGISDGINAGGVQTYAESLAESFGISESTAAGVVYLSGLTDSAAVAESLTSAAQFSQALVDAHGLSEAVAAQVRAAVSAAENVSITDSVGAARSFAEILAEALAIAEAQTAQQSATVVVNESTLVTDETEAEGGVVSTVTNQWMAVECSLEMIDAVECQMECFPAVDVEMEG